VGLIFRLKLIIVILITIFLWYDLAESISISPSLEKSIDIAGNINPDSTVKIIVFAESNQPGSSSGQALKHIKGNFNARHNQVVSRLKSDNRHALDVVKNRIKALYPSAEFRDFWVTPAVAFEIPVRLLSDLIDVPGVVSIIEDGRVEFIEPVESTFAPAKIGAVRDHLISMNIPALWARGLDGSGRLVCNFDTGVESTHEALQSKWRGNSSELNAAWFAPHLGGVEPTDKQGHGTESMGVMVGSTPADSFGVAPGAQWIAAAVVDQGETLENTFSDIIAGFEWAIDPDGDPSTSDDVPDVILNSWGVPVSILPPCDETFNQIIDNVEAAGIVTIFAAGNEGPNPYSLRLPANRAASPLNAFSVGAIDPSTNTVAPFSSRGPSSCDSISIKPEVVAPGVGIYTSYKNGTYRYVGGTSFAAPFVAGLVALLRQYNPDATVDEIKNAIIESAIDLGPVGEDNDYGHGLPDAELAISYMPLPEKPDIYITKHIIGGDGLADPGDVFDLFVGLQAAADVFDSLTGYLISSEAGVAFPDSQAAFVFAPGNTQTINISPFVVEFDNNYINGDRILFDLILHLPHGTPYDTVDLGIIVGTIPAGDMADHVTSSLQFTVSDFGQYGLAENSIYSAGGHGFKYNGSENILYEAGIIAGRNSLQLSSSVRDSLGYARQSDFIPVQGLQFSNTTHTGGIISTAEFVDSESPISIPVSINQNIISYDLPDNDNYVIFKYYLINNTNELLTDLSFGFLTDFDLAPDGDMAGFNPDLNLYFQEVDNLAAGVMPLNDYRGIASLDNGVQKLAMTQQDKLDIIRQQGVDINSCERSDWMSVIAFGPYDILPYDSVEVALAVLAGNDVFDLANSAVKAAERYFGVTDTDEFSDILPSEFELAQNYPNPFNPSTIISFNIKTATHVRLDIFNILGHKVATVFDGRVSAGGYSVEWDGTASDGSKTASGVYFYRLKAGACSQTKKMLLLK
jgi:hypothetical protein